MSLDATKLNLMKQRKFIPVSEFTGVQQKAFTPTGADLADLDVNVMDDDSAASNGTKVYCALERSKTQEAMLWSEMANSATVYIQTDTGSLKIPVIHKPVEDATVTIKDDDSASSNGTAIYAVPIAGPNTNSGTMEAILVSANAGNADSDFDTSSPTDTCMVYDNPMATVPPGALAIYCDEDAATATSRLLINNPTLTDLYVRCNSGRMIKLTHDASAASNGVQVYFDDDGGTEAQRLLFVSPTDTNATCTAGNQLGLFALDNMWVSPIYFDDDAATESERLLCAIGAGVSAYVFCISGNRMLKITYNADPGTPGVQLYIDDDGAEITERLIAVNAGDADSTVQISPTYTIYGDTDVISAIAVNTLLVSAGAGNPPLVEIGTTGIMAVQMEDAGDDIRHTMLLPSDWNREADINVRVIWSTESVTTTDTVTWKVLYGTLIPDDTTNGVIAAPATALDTAIAADTVLGVAKTVHRTAAGVINAGTIGGTALYFSFLVEADAQVGNPLTDGVYLLGIEFEYTPRLSPTVPRSAIEARDWSP